VQNYQSDKEVDIELESANKSHENMKEFVARYGASLRENRFKELRDLNNMHEELAEMVQTDYL